SNPMADEKHKKPRQTTHDEDEFVDEELDSDFGSDAFDGDSEHLFDEAEFEAEGWNIPRDPESIARALRSLEGWLPGILKRSDSGAAADPAESAQSAETSSSSEGIRARLGDRKLPREVINFILSQVDNTKREFLRI